MLKKRNYIIYIVIVLVVLLIPFAGMVRWASNETTENTTLAEWPEFTKEGKINTRYLSDMGTYFEDHFAFRQNFVTANAVLRDALVKTSATDQVIIGEKDWLYYEGTLDDYMGRDLLSDRELYAVAHNLNLMQSYVQSRGSQFLFTLAPNKNTLYNDSMPYFITKGEDSNLKRLTPLLEEFGIAYLDLYKLFSRQDEVLYFHRDSHWNNRGAILAYNGLLDSLNVEHESYLNVPYDIQEEHTGDIDEMLFPFASQKEDNYIYEKELSYQYLNEVTDDMDNWIETSNPQKSGTLLMYRDSFGESLLPLMAEEMGTAYFSRLVPYNLAQIEQYRPDYVIIERVERRIASFIESAPIMEPLPMEPVFVPEAESSSILETEKQGSYLLIQGIIDENYMQENTEIYISVRDSATLETRMYPAFYIQSTEGDGNGYQLYVNGSSLPEGNVHISVIVKNDTGTTSVVAQDMEWNQGGE